MAMAQSKPGFREEVKALRARLGASQFVFAEAVGVNFATLRSWEMGRFVPDYPALLLAGLEKRVGEILATRGKLGSRRRGRPRKKESKRES